MENYRWIVGTHSMEEIQKKLDWIKKKYGNGTLVVDSTEPYKSYIEWSKE